VGTRRERCCKSARIQEVRPQVSEASIHVTFGFIFVRRLLREVLFDTRNQQIHVDPQCVHSDDEQPEELSDPVFPLIDLESLCFNGSGFSVAENNKVHSSF